MNETICTIMKRDSLRRYKEENISDEHLDIILNSAMRAPTAGNMMTYSTAKNKYNAKNYAQMHYNFKVKAPFSKEMQRSVEEALKEWDKKE